MRILIISAFYPPNVIGGAEICARNLGCWFADNGHEVAVLTTAPEKSQAVWDGRFEGSRMFRIWAPRIYPVFQASMAPEWKKPFWHLQDLFDPRNEAIMNRVLDEVKPDFIHIHWIQGIGYNALKSIGARDIPTAITLHDLSYACVKTTMFKGGHECVRQCGSCAFSSKFKLSYLRTIPRLGFISPSRANLDKLSQLLPIGDYPNFHIINPNRYPRPAARHAPSDEVRLMFAGRLEKTKGINLLLEVLEPLAEQYRFSLKVHGTGPEEEELRARYDHHPWLDMTGQVSLQQVSDSMATSDLLIVPSIWLENSPGVVFQALGVSLPVMGSDKGGLPELIEPGVNGFLVPPGDAGQWTAAIRSVLESPGQLAALRENAARGSAAFDPDVLAQRTLEAFDQISGQPLSRR